MTGRPTIKICGISTPATLEAAIAARADHVGFVFYPPSPRHLGLRDAAVLAEQAGERIGRVGLFVDADEGTIADAVTAARLDAVQLHGRETPVQAHVCGPASACRCGRRCPSRPAMTCAGWPITRAPPT